MTNLDELLRDMREAFAAAGIASPAADAELLAAHVLGQTRGRVQALALMGKSVDEQDRARLRALAAERATRVPLQHLTGRAPFRGLELAVGPGVFVPRPETEGVAQHAIDALAAVPDPEPLAVDLCTGSGALALALAAEVPGARVWAVEMSPEAHAWASRNVAEHGQGRVELLLGDVRELDPRAGLRAGAGAGGGSERAGADSAGLVAAFAPLRGRVHVLVSNPPYVPDDMVPRDPEVSEHDPELALYSGADGLDLIRVISRVGLDLVAPGGTLVLEHAEQQGAAIRALLGAAGWSDAATYPDLTGRDRATVALR